MSVLFSLFFFLIFVIDVAILESNETTKTSTTNNLANYQSDFVGCKNGVIEKISPGSVGDLVYAILVVISK